MKRIIGNEQLQVKLAEALAVTPPTLTPRDVRLPGIEGKSLAVIGVRRGGKTSWLHQQRAARLAHGRPLESQLLLGLEDERLVGMTALDLGWMLDEHARLFPALRAQHPLSLYLDEIQVVDGWASLVHRLIEGGGVELFVSGSSAKLLSREVATAARGRLLEVLVHPFSFREALRHTNAEPPHEWGQLAPVERDGLTAHLRQYLQVGGFPEAQRAERRDRLRLLSGYVDSMVLRDVIDRHRVSNPTALRALQRHLLANPGGRFTVQKFFQALRSQGVSVGKDTLHAYLEHLQDAFLVRVIDMHSNSERQRMVNPRKVYPIDTGLIALYERPGQAHLGRALETAVLLELERREYAVSWLRVDDEREVDFLASRPGDPPQLVQVCLDTSDDATWEREVRALELARGRFPDAEALLITHDASPPARPLPNSIRWYSATEWLIG
jgi:predicted AAA+ superfamily ATPase